jgi:hypothetical protein
MTAQRSFAAIFAFTDWPHAAFAAGYYGKNLAG